MKLIKLQDKFILVNDEETLKAGDCTITYPNLEIYQVNQSTCIMYNEKIIAGIPELPAIDFSLLSEEDCKRIGWVDVEKLGFDRAVERLWNPKSMETRRVGNEIIEAVKFGFKTAQSLNDKMFSLEQVMEAISMARDINDGKDYFTAEDISGCTEVCTYGWKNRYFDSDIIQSLQQTEWNVEVEMEYQNLDGKWSSYYPFASSAKDVRPKITNNSIKVLRIL